MFLRTNLRRTISGARMPRFSQRDEPADDTSGYSCRYRFAHRLRPFQPHGGALDGAAISAALRRNDASERLVIVAEDPSSQGSGQNKITAFLVARCVASEWELENIVVASDHRRRGLGEQLLQFLFALARHARGEAIFLEVRESNAAARAFYEKLGFEQMGRRKGYYAELQEDAIIYRRMLK